MSELTVNELKEKINLVSNDINQLLSTGDTGRKLEVLTQYKEFLEEELSFIEKDNSTKT